MSEDLMMSVQARAINPKTINDMTEGVTPPYVLPDPATVDQVAEAEDALGFEIPELLGLLYINVADGGFGPGYGLVGVADEDRGEMGGNLVQSYRNYLTNSPQEFGAPWQPKLLPILTWGCGILSCIDCADPDFPVYFLDPGEHCLDDVEVTLEHPDGTVEKLDGFPGMGESKPKREDRPQGLQLRKEAASFEEFMEKWADGVNLWDEMMGEG